MKTTPATYIDDAINRWQNVRLGTAIHNRCSPQSEWELRDYIEDVECARLIDDTPRRTLDEMTDALIIRMMASPWKRLTTPAARLKSIFSEDFE